MMKKIFFTLVLMGVNAVACANTVSFPMYLMGRGQLQKPVGTAVLTDTSNGVSLQPNLTNLTPTLAPGAHGVFLRSGSCIQALRHYANLGTAASAVTVNADGSANAPVVVAPNKTLAMLSKEAVVIQGGDNGQGNHIVCGMVPQSSKPMLGQSQ